LVEFRRLQQKDATPRGRRRRQPFRLFGAGGSRATDRRSDDEASARGRNHFEPRGFLAIFSISDSRIATVGADFSGFSFVNVGSMARLADRSPAPGAWNRFGDQAS
jgi:hypothetical protein